MDGSFTAFGSNLKTKNRKQEHLPCSQGLSANGSPLWHRLEGPRKGKGQFEGVRILFWTHPCTQIKNAPKSGLFTLSWGSERMAGPPFWAKIPRRLSSCRFFYAQRLILRPTPTPGLRTAALPRTPWPCWPRFISFPAKEFTCHITRPTFAEALQVVHATDP